MEGRRGDTGHGDRPSGSRRPTVVLVDFPDVFEDFYPAYGVTPDAFVAQWDGTGNHRFATVLQRAVGDVVWYVHTVGSDTPHGTHAHGFSVQFLRSSSLHRRLWHWFYVSPRAWRRHRWWRAYGTAASYLAPLSASTVRALRRRRPDAFFVQDFATGRFDLAVLAGALLRAPVVAYHSGSLPDRWFGAPLRHLTLRRAARVIVQTDDVRRELERAGVDPARVIDVPTPVDTERYEPRPRAEACAQVGLDESLRYVLFLGRLDDPVKRVSSLIDVVAQLPDVVLLIAGDGPDRAALEKRAAAMGRTRFLGWVDDPDTKAALLAVADCLVLASRSEGAPTAVLEALACGTYVVATRVGALPSLVVEGETGTTVEPGDDVAFAAAVAHALHHKDHDLAARHSRQRMSESGAGLGGAEAMLVHLFAELGVRDVR
jgi:glycosyltransferase involved in cell wall biosynthesis